jgi:glutamyl-tRNA reductase
LILDLSIPKNVHADVEELEGNPNSYGLFSQLTDETLEIRKNHIPAEAIIEEIKEEFNVWTKGRKFAPTIHALKENSML